MQDLARDVIVQLKLKHSGERVIVVIGRRVVDVCLGRGVAEFFPARRGWLDALKIGNVFPPPRIPLVGRQIFLVNVRFPMRHHAAREINERNRARERVVEQEGGFVRLKVSRKNAARLQIRDLTRGQRNQFSNPFVKSGIRAETQQIWDFRTRIGFEIVAVAKLMMRGEKPS